MQKIKTMVEDAIKKKSFNDMKKAIESLSQTMDAAPDVKVILNLIAGSLPNFKNTESLEICKQVIEAWKTRINFFSETDAVFKRSAAQIYDAQDSTYEAILVM